MDVPEYDALSDERTLELVRAAVRRADETLEAIGAVPVAPTRAAQVAVDQPAPRRRRAGAGHDSRGGRVIDVMPYRLWVNEARTVLVRVWESGLVEVCFREQAGDIWGPPIRVVEES